MLFFLSTLNMFLSDGIEEATVEEATVTMINMTKAQHLQKILLCFIWCTPSQFVDFLLFVIHR